MKRRDCLVCTSAAEVFEAVNEAIWDGREPAYERRVRGYARLGATVLAAHGRPKTDHRVLGRHAKHVEASYREATGNTMTFRHEAPLYATDFESVTDRFAHLGMVAAEKVAERLPDMDDKQMLQVASMGLKAATVRQVSEQRAKRAPNVTIQAIFGVTAGFLANDNPYRNVTSSVSEADLVATLDAERETLKLLTSGE